MLQLPKPVHLESDLHNKKSHGNEKAVYGNYRHPCSLQLEKNPRSNKDPAKSKIDLKNKIKKIKILVSPGLLDLLFYDLTDIALFFCYYWPLYFNMEEFIR